MSTPAPDSTFTPATGLLAGLDLLQISQDGAVLHIRLNRPVKRNAINDGLIAQLHATSTPRSCTRAAGMPPSTRSSSAGCR